MQSLHVHIFGHEKTLIFVPQLQTSSKLEIMKKTVLWFFQKIANFGVFFGTIFSHFRALVHTVYIQSDLYSLIRF